VEIDNQHGDLRPGEFVRAKLEIPLLAKDGKAQETIVVPRNSLLSIGQTSLVYVEGIPGEFQLRHVTTGPTAGGLVAIFDGLSVGDQVVAQSTFLLDAQMQLQGNPSLIDPDKAVAENVNSMDPSDAGAEDIPTATDDSMPQMDLPQMDLPQMDLPQMELPQMELPQMELPK
jgi:hypothetical protein